MSTFTADVLRPFIGESSGKWHLQEYVQSSTLILEPVDNKHEGNRVHKQYIWGVTTTRETKVLDGVVLERNWKGEPN